jgi:hypothetical protein
MASEYPVGAAWEFVAPEGDGLAAGARGRVWLDRRDGGREVWRWSWRYADGSGHESDWAPSRQKALEECRTKFALATHRGCRGGRSFRVRFRRTNEAAP